MLGVAILGTEVCFSQPHKGEHGHIFTNASKWYDLYDGTIVREIDEVAEMCRKDEE